MRNYISERLNHIEPSKTVELTTKIARLREEGQHIIGLNVGEPDFATPEHISQAAEKAMAEGFTKYTPVMGLRELRETICWKFQEENGITYDPDQITIGAGAKQCLYAALLAICNEGDEIIIPTPCWVSYKELVKMAGGVPVMVPGHEDFSLDLAAIEDAVTEKTKGILINTPNNPTGAVYNREELEGLAEIICKHDLCVISDEVYEKLIYGESEHISIASLSDEMKERTILVNSFSKTYAMTGWRLGYIAAARDIVKAVNVMQSQMVSSVHSLSQKAGIAALRGSQEPVEKMRQAYEERRDYLYERLSRIDGIKCQKSKGAFYLLPDISAYLGRKWTVESEEGKNTRIVEDDLDLAAYILEEAHVAVVPGSAFLAPGHLRFTYSASMEELKNAMNGIENALKKLGAA